MNRAIICGVDDSESAKRAARVARSLSSKLGLRVIFVRAVDRSAADADVAAVAERLERLSAGVNGADCGAAWSVELGHPADALVAAAKEADAAMIVVGSTGPRSSLLGSISADVSRRAPCPVVVVPPDADDSVNGSKGTGHSPTHIARFGLGGSETGFAGGIARFGLGSD